MEAVVDLTSEAFRDLDLTESEEVVRSLVTDRTLSAIEVLRPGAFCAALLRSIFLSTFCSIFWLIFRSRS